MATMVVEVRGRACLRWRRSIASRTRVARCALSLLGVTAGVLTVGCSGYRIDDVDSRREIDHLIDRFHESAATADFDAYFETMTDNAVFLGTDATERWPVAEFKTWARPHFAGESAWVFEPVQRWLTFADDGRTAWFEEELTSRSYGRCRGTGVVLATELGWRIAQYSLSVPIPNELLPQVVAEIRRRSR